MWNTSDDVSWLMTSWDNSTSAYYNVTTVSYNDTNNDNESTSEVIMWLDSLLPPLLFTVGLISNTLVILVMRSKYFRSTSTSFYMIITAGTDSLCLLLALPPHYVYVNFPSSFKLMEGKHWICSLFNVIGWGTSDLGIYFTVAMTIERAIGVWKPLKISEYCTVRKAKILVVILIFLELVKLSPIAAKSRVVDFDLGSQLCDIDRNDRVFVNFYDKVWSWVHVGILTVCYILAMCGNCVIIFYVRKSSKERRLYSSRRTIVKRSELRKISQNKQISIMLVIDSFTLILCTLPFAVVNVFASKWRIFLNSGSGKNFAITCSFYLLYVNRCVNLFLYCVSGQRFRKAMKTVICGCFTSKSRRCRQVHQNNCRHAQRSANCRSNRSEFSSDTFGEHPRHNEFCLAVQNDSSVNHRTSHISTDNPPSDQLPERNDEAANPSALNATTVADCHQNEISSDLTKPSENNHHENTPLKRCDSLIENGIFMRVLSLPDPGWAKSGEEHQRDRESYADFTNGQTFVPTSDEDLPNISPYRGGFFPHQLEISIYPEVDQDKKLLWNFYRNEEKGNLKLYYCDLFYV